MKVGRLSGQQESSHEYTITKLNNTGLVFETVTTAQFFSKTLNVLTYLEIPSYENELQEIGHYINILYDMFKQ